MGMLNWLTAKLQNRRYALKTPNRNILYFGTIVKMHYSNWKNDPNPLIWVQFSSPKYTHGINLNYLDNNDKKWLARAVYLIKKGNQIMDPRTFYKFIKLNRYNVARKAYRLYFTSLIQQPKMVSSGITNLSKLVYPFNDAFIKSLNNYISSQQLRQTSVPITYSQSELKERVINTVNAKSIHSKTVAPAASRAKWLKNS